MRNERHADFPRGYRSDIDLAGVTPVDLYEISPGLYSEVPAVSETPGIAGEVIQPGPSPHARSGPVRANDPASRESTRVRLHRIALDAGNWRRPEHLDIRPLRLFNQMTVQLCAAEAEYTAIRKVGGHRVALAVELNAAESEAFARRQNHSDLAGRGDRIRHESFPASLVDGRTFPVREHDAESSIARRNCRGETRRSAADHKNIGIRHRYRNVTSSNQVDRGKYLVEEVAKCQECHTPRTADGAMDTTKWLKGATLNFAPIHPVEGWHKTAPDLTGSSSLFKRWEAKGITAFLMTTKNPRGNKADPPMPAYRLNQADA